MLEWYKYSLSVTSIFEFISTLFKSLIRENNTMRDSKKICIRSFLSKSGISIIDENFMSFFFKVGSEFFCPLEIISNYDDNVGIWGNIGRPDESRSICHFFCDKAHESRNPDTITPHDDIFGRTISILIFESEGIRKS